MHAPHPIAGEPPAPESYSYEIFDMTLLSAIHDGTATPAQREAHLLACRRALDEISRMVRHDVDPDDVILASLAERQRREIAQLLAPEFRLVPMHPAGSRPFAAGVPGRVLLHERER